MRTFAVLAALVMISLLSIPNTVTYARADDGSDTATDTVQRHVIEGEVSAYNSDPDQTDDSPFTTASGEQVRPGIVANNCLPFGTKVVIDGKRYEVQDRMNKRYGCKHFDLWMEEHDAAMDWGRRELAVEIIK